MCRTDASDADFFFIWLAEDIDWRPLFGIVAICNRVLSRAEGLLGGPSYAILLRFFSIQSKVTIRCE